jgi:maltose O-acetyltransferase
MFNNFIVLIVNFFIIRYNKIKLRTLKFAQLGKNVQILNGFEIGYANNCHIEDDVVVGLNAYLNCQGGVYIKRGTIIGPNLTVYSVNHKYLDVRALPFDEDIIKKEVVINENCWIGCNVTILPGVEIGEGSVIAAGAVLTKSIPSFSLVGGNPASIIKEIKNENYYELKKENKIFNYINKADL